MELSTSRVTPVPNNVIRDLSPIWRVVHPSLFNCRMRNAPVFLWSPIIGMSLTLGSWKAVIN